MKLTKSLLSSQQLTRKPAGYAWTNGSAAHTVVHRQGLQPHAGSTSGALALPIKLLLVLVATLAVTGGLIAGDLFRRDPSPLPVAHLGEPLEIPGGLLRVDQVIPEHMVAMQHEKFAQAGMAMSAMGMDMAPEGYRRFTVELTLASQNGDDLRYTAEQFRVTGDGMEATGPLRHKLGNGVVPPGSATSGRLVFQAPETASNLLLHFAGHTQPISLDLQPTSHGNDQDGEHADHEH